MNHRKIIGGRQAFIIQRNLSSAWGAWLTFDHEKREENT